MINLIQQQHLHVDVNGTESDGLALQARLAALCRDWLPPALDRVLERSTPQDGSLCIERLDIDAGTISLERLEHDLPHKVAQALEKALQELVTNETLISSERSVTIQHKTAHVATSEGFLHFLKTGSLPWSFRLPAGQTLEMVMLSSWRTATQSGASFLPNREEIGRLLSHPMARRRLVYQFSSELTMTLLALLSPEAKIVLEQALSAIRYADLPPNRSKDLSLHFWDTVLSRVAHGQTISFELLINDAGESGETIYPNLVDVLVLRDHQWEKDVPPSSSFDRKPGKAELRSVSDPVSPEHPDIDIALQAVSEHPDAREGIYIDNAGLVLLHPFLPQFFQTLRLADNDKILHPGRTLVLLHFLTTGQIKAPEYELVLPKILCGLPLCEPVDTDLELSSGEMTEAGALLKAVIGHWEVLRNTSPDGLRGTFLIRPGKLSLPDDNWLLQVELHSFDILLDHLPWGISMIKLPWMERMLSVRWR